MVHGFRLVFFIFAFFCNHVFLYGTSSPHFVGLGRDCQIADAFNTFQLRQAAFPLDWVVSHNFEGVIQAFEDDFKHFLDPIYLVYAKTHVINSYYGFGFNHFFPLEGVPVTEHITVPGTVVKNYLDYLPAVQVTQGRRIQRVKDLLSSDEFVIFVRTHIVPSQAENFVARIRKKYPNLRFLLVVVHENLDLIGDWKLDRVLNFFACRRRNFADWWDNSEWATVFYHVLNLDYSQY